MKNGEIGQIQQKSDSVPHHPKAPELQRFYNISNLIRVGLLIPYVGEKFEIVTNKNLTTKKTNTSQEDKLLKKRICGFLLEKPILFD